MSVRTIIVAASCALLLLGCQSAGEKTGRVLGSIAGGVLGSKVGAGAGRSAAIIAGSIAGSYIGGSIGRSMDERDLQRSQQALEYNHVNETSAWRNPDSGYSYRITPIRTYQTDSGPCREYTTEATIEGRVESTQGTACRQPDGSWQAASQGN